MKTTFIWACLFGITAIGIGALGAHGLREILSASQLESVATGVKYQMYHSFFLLFVGVMQIIKPKINLQLVRNLAVVGVFFFSFSIYLLTAQTQMGFSIPFLWAFTPLGGIILISAWLVLLLKIALLANDI